jgi:hypothetical protein
MEGIAMKPSIRKTLYGLTVALVIASLSTLGAGIAWAQLPEDDYQIGYYDSPDCCFPTNRCPGSLVLACESDDVRFDSPGTSNSTRNVCAMIYVFAADQQLTECCGCLATPNGLRTLAVRRDLTSNPLTGVKSKNGVIKIVSSAVNNSPCDPTSNVTPKANLRAWGTHTQNAVVGPTFAVTETQFSDSRLGATELANLQAQCAFINILGSGHGTCTCGTGD